MLRRVVSAWLLLALCAGSTASAQGPANNPQRPPATQTAQAPPAQPPAQPAAAPQTGETELRPATTTHFGDTGLWFVPTANVLPDRLWSVSGYRVNFDREQGFTDVSHFLGTFAFGVRGHTEIFGSFRFITRIDRDIRPLFDTSGAGGLVNNYPLVKQGWSENKVGDLLVGAKYSILSEHRERPVSLAVRGTLKLPTGDEETGTGTGKTDFMVEAIVSKEINQRVEVSGFGGPTFRASPDDIEISNSFRWGVGAAFPTRRPLRFFAELHGEQYFDDVTTTAPIVFTAEDGTVPPILSENVNDLDANIGLTWQDPRGFFVGAGFSYAFKPDGRSNFGPFEDEGGDNLGFQFRLGYHPGVSTGVVIAPPPPPPPPPPPANRPPTVKAQCDPCTVQINQASTVTCTAQDPDGDPLTYRWSAPTGTFANPATRQTTWTAPGEPGPVPVTCTVDDGRGGTASDSVTIQVVRPAVREYVFEDVHFDFDRYTLRPEATRVLDEAVRAMRDNATLRIEVEGHTCNIGTAEYNLALGDRRAQAVRGYLTSQGITADRLRTISYGEERPKHDNAREETRRLNRRAAMVVRVQQ